MLIDSRMTSCDTDSMLDDLDRKLISELARDARVSSAELSRKFGANATTIRRRIAKLKRQGVISTTIVPDASKLGYTIVAIIALQVELAYLDEVAQRLAEFPNVHYVAYCTGSYDMFVGAWFTSAHDLTAFVKDHLAKIPGLKRSETFMVVDVKRNDFGWLTRLEYLSSL